MIAGRAGLVVEVRAGVEQFRDDDRGVIRRGDRGAERLVLEPHDHLRIKQKRKIK